MIKKALCIGNNSYNESLGKLDFAINDSNCMKKTLESLGYLVREENDLDSIQFAECIGKMKDELSDCDIYIFYYAGHGFEINGENLLIPIDRSSTETPDVLCHCSYKLNEIMSIFNNYSSVIKIVILDACRCPHTQIRGSETKGFGSFLAPGNTIIAFSTSPGQFAREDIKSQHGLYTGILLNNILNPKLSVEKLFKTVRQEMALISNNQQISWEHSSLIDDVYISIDSIEDCILYYEDCYKDEWKLSSVYTKK